jgi:hypothetical protein
VLALALLAGAAVAFSVAGLATKDEDKPRVPATTGYFSGSGGSAYDFTPSNSYFPK